jgi:hypothetical protein
MKSRWVEATSESKKVASAKTDGQDDRCRDGEQIDEDASGGQAKCGRDFVR